MLKQKNILRCLALMLAAVLLTGLCSVALAQTAAAVQVMYYTPDGIFASERVNVDGTNNVVSPNARLVPADYEPVNAAPVTLIFDKAGRPIPNLIYFTYNKPVQGHQIKVEYATMSEVFNTEYVTITADSNVITPNAAMVPAGYLPLNAGSITVPFRSNNPVVNTVRFTYFIDKDLMSGGSINDITTGTTSSAAQNIIMNWDVPGEIVTFGSYEQDNNTANGKEPVEWYVLRTDRGRALLMSVYALDTRPFNEDWIKVSWSGCDLRTWLNGTFYKTCFNATERKAVMHSSVSSNYVDNAVETKDYVFCLSAAEAKKYLKGDLILCKPTRYAREKSTATNNGCCYWWLRDTTHRKNDANRVEPDGVIAEYGANTNATGVGIRPVIWVNVEKAFGN